MTGVLTLAAASSVAPAVASEAPAAPARPRLTDAQVAALDPAAQAVLLDPLRDAAAALDAVGRRADPLTYAGVALDASAGRTDLYLTDPGLAPGLVAAASAADPALTLQQVDVHAAAYPLALLDSVSATVVDTPEPYAVDAAYPAPDASGVVAEVSDPALAQADAKAAGGRMSGVPVTFVRGTPRQPHAWDDVKWHDRAPFIGGDVITTDGRRYCTTGLPAVRVKDRHPVMVTANHCFDRGQRVYTGAGRTWDYRNRRTGHFVGTVTRTSTAWDAEILDGADNNADESDTDGWKPLTSVGYSYRGDYVCHSGAKSAAKGHPTPCGIKVTIADLRFREGGHSVRGVEGVDVHGWGSVGGDSGGTVFAVRSDHERQLRGMVSSGGTDGTDDQRRVDWPEAVDIFRTFGLELNPRS